jgi:inner membrane protein YidH
MASKPSNTRVLTDSDRQTIMASERTQLAWWRTGLTAIAVALAVGRFLPDLAGSGSRWAYTVIGMGFAFYGIAMIAYGTNRARAVDEAFEGSTRSRTRDPVRLFLAGAGVLLGLATAILILFN